MMRYALILCLLVCGCAKPKNTVRPCSSIDVKIYYYDGDAKDANGNEVCGKDQAPWFMSALDVDGETSISLDCAYRPAARP